MRYAKEGIPFIVGGLILALGAVLLGYRYGGAWWVLALVIVAVAMWVPYYFRDPERTGDRDVRRTAGTFLNAVRAASSEQSAIRVQPGERTSAGTPVIAELRAA